MNVSGPQAKELFVELLHVPPKQRDERLAQACGDDEELRRRVQALLRAHSVPDSFLEQPAVAPDGEGTINLPPAERPGIQIGVYKLLQQIGEGGMGVVYMAEQLEPVKRRVALKVIKPGMDSRQVLARFEAERQALSLMDHPNIARVLDAGATDFGRPYFVMELVHGVPITQYCDEHHLTPRQRLELLLPVCQAIQHAHQKGIIHRDIKPTNILIAEYDQLPVPKVIDFGVAKATGSPLTEMTMFTGYGQIVGTLEYMSPEQAKVNQLDIDTRSDIYSLGVLLYELLTGSTPLDKERLRSAGWDEMLRIIREEEPPKPSTRLSESGRQGLGAAAVGTQSGRTTLASIAAVRSTQPAQLTRLVRGELDWIAMKALDKDRSRRYETASALAADLSHYLNDEPVVACPPSAAYRFVKFARRHQRALVTAVVVALAVLLTAAASGVLVWRAAESERRGAYYQRIALTEREWGANNLSRMEELLNNCPVDLRGWEWRYLKRLRYGALSPVRHESGVYCSAFSPDGQYLATSTKDGIVRLCRATGQELQKWHAHEVNATCVQFSPDSRFLVSGGWDGKVKVWDVQKALQGEFQSPLFELEHSSRIRVWSVDFSPSGERLASSGGRTADEQGEVKVWDLKTRQAVFTLRDFTDRVSCVRYSPDGRRIATAGRAVQVWDAQTGRELLKVRGHDTRAEGLAFSPDGRRLATVAGLLFVHRDQEVKVWDAYTGQEIFSLHGHVGALRAVAFSPDGRRLASAGLDQTIKVWDTASGLEVITLRGHFDNIFCLSFSPDGHRLASGSIDRTVRIWDATPPGQDTGPEYFTLRGHTGTVTDVAFHPTDGRTLVSAGTDGTVRLWDFWSGKPQSTLSVVPSAVRLKVAYNPDGRHLATVSAEAGRPVKLWDVAAAREVCDFAASTDELMGVTYSPDGRHVAAGGFDFVVHIWDTTTRQEIRQLAGHEWPIHAVAFSPDGRHLASCSADSTVRVWDWTTGEALPVLEPQHAARVANVAFSRDGMLLASASWDRTIKVWDTATWKLVHDLHDSTEAAVQCVAFGPDSRRLVWGSTDGTIKVWDGPGSETHVLRGHTSWVQAVAVSLDGQWIASASLDGTAKVWKAPPEPSAPMHEAEVQARSGGHSAAED